MFGLMLKKAKMWFVRAVSAVAFVQPFVRVACYAWKMEPWI